MASSSDAARPRLAGVLLLLVLALAPSTAPAKVFYTRSEALDLAFPGSDRIDKKTFILTEEQTRAIEALARCELDSKLVTIYTGWKGEELLGYAHIDVHTVRTQPEGLLVVLTPSGVVRSLRVLAFHEPLDYLPSERWYGQLEGKSASAALRIGRDVHGVVGATLSARAATRSVRRALAYHEVLIGNDR